MTIREILIQGKLLLASSSCSSCIDTPDLDAALLLGNVMHKTRTQLLMCSSDTVSEAEEGRFFALIERRRNGECIAYIVSNKEFRGLDFNVNPSVLVPRPDTETLVEAALHYIDIQAESSPALLDLCTGSGAVAVALKNERPKLSVSASDISHDALETARYNAQKLLGTKPEFITFIQSDLFKGIDGCFDIIVSNPPYIPTGELNSLSHEVRREPELALDGGDDGLSLIREIIASAREHLTPSGILLLEADPRQMRSIRMLLETQGFSGICVHKDLANDDRVISCCQKIHPSLR